MTTANPVATPIVEPVVGAAAPTCDACQHPLAAHDPIGLRFCAATGAAALTRGCVCR